MTSHRHPTGDRGVSTPESKDLKTEIHRLLEHAQVPRKVRTEWTQRLMKHTYSDLELRWMLDHLQQAVQKI